MPLSAKLNLWFESLVPEVYTIGDAKEARHALDAVREGFLVGLKI